MSFQTSKTFVHFQNTTIYFWWNPRAFWPCIDSNATDKFKTQKGSKDIVKIIHVTSVVNVVVALLSMQSQKALGFHQKYLNLCSEDELRPWVCLHEGEWLMTKFTFLGELSNSLCSPLHSLYGKSSEKFLLLSLFCSTVERKHSERHEGEKILILILRWMIPFTLDGMLLMNMFHKKPMTFLQIQSRPSRTSVRLNNRSAVLQSVSF